MFHSLSLRERVRVRGKFTGNIPLILSFSRREKGPESGACENYYLLPVITLFSCLLNDLVVSKNGVGCALRTNPQIND